MSTFRTAVAALLNQDIYVLNFGTPLKAKIVRIKDDLVELDPEPANIKYKIVMHIDALMFATP